MIFGGKKKVEKLEEEFKTKNLKDKPVFYDLDIPKVEDPEDLRSFLLESCREKGYGASLNKLTKFPSEEFEGVFKGGEMKPIRGLLKGKKKIKKGIKHPILSFFLIIASAFLLVLSFKPNLFGLGLQGKGLLLAIGSIFLAIIAFLVSLIKKRLLLSLWVKIVGIHDIGEGKADIRVVLAGEPNKKKGKERLEDDLSAIYESITDIYLGKELPKPKEEEPIIKKKEKGAKGKIIDKISRTVDDLDRLDSRLSRGEINKEEYKKLKKKLKRKKRKYETLLDVVK